jgi:hypothetical protein
MPWSASDAERHARGLSAHQRRVWARVANNALRTCLADGGGQEECEGRAIRQANAVARRAPAKAIKADADGGLEVLAIPFGGPFGGKDLDGEYFSDNTDLCLDWFPARRPLLYQHGLDAELGVTPVGTVDVATAAKDDAGWWVRAQLERAGRYWRHIAALLEEDDGEGLFASSAAMPHLVRKADDGEILRWPWVELSLTPTPANFFATVEPALAKAHYKAAGLAAPATPHLRDRAPPAPSPRGRYVVVAGFRIPGDIRRAAQEAANVCADDLGIKRRPVRFFDDAGEGRLLEAMASGAEPERFDIDEADECLGVYRPEVPNAVYVKVTDSARVAAGVASHEVRHAWQHLTRGAPAPEERDEYERDAHRYSDEFAAWLDAQGGTL